MYAINKQNKKSDKKTWQVCQIDVSHTTCKHNMEHDIQRYSNIRMTTRKHI